MGTMADIFLGPKTNDPAQVRSPFEAFGAGLGSGFGGGFAKEADPETQRKRRKEALDIQKSHGDTAETIIKIFDIPDIRVRKSIMSAYLRASGADEKSPTYKLMIDLASSDNPETVAGIKSMAASLGTSPEGLIGWAKAFEKDPNKLKEILQAKQAGEQETAAASIRSDQASGAISRPFNVSQGIQGQELADPRDLLGPLSLARQRAAGVMGETGQKLREGLSLSGVPEGRLEAMLTARSYGNNTGNPSIDAMSISMANRLLQDLRTKPGVVDKSERGQSGDSEVVRFYDKSGKQIASHTVGDLKENIGTQLGQEGDRQHIVTYNKRTGKELGRLDIGEKPLDLAQKMADLSLMAQGLPPQYKKDYPDWVTVPSVATRLIQDITNIDPLKAMLSSGVKEGGSPDLSKVRKELPADKNYKLGTVYKTPKGDAVYLGKDKWWPLF